MARHIGDGRFVCADGQIYEYEAEVPDWCSTCEEERADGSDGLCAFCRHDAEVDRRIAAREAEVERLLKARREAEQRLERWLAADPSRGAADANVAHRIEQLRRVG